MKHVLLAALMCGAASSAAVFAHLPVPLCRVEARASPELPGIYTVTVSTTTTLTGLPCPANGYAVVRLESGRQYPLTVVTPDRPMRRPGIPWYWRLAWQSISGRLYRVQIPGLAPPFNLDVP